MLVVYGFHPEEPLAEEVGERLRGWKSERVEAIRFRPSYMPDNVHHLLDEEGIRITLDGIRELKEFVDTNYESKFIMDLHETPSLRKTGYEQYGICFPAWNAKLEKALKDFRDSTREKFLLIGHSPRGSPSYHSATLEYFSKVRKDNRILTLRKEQGQGFTKDIIDYLLERYVQRNL